MFKKHLVGSEWFISRYVDGNLAVYHAPTNPTPLVPVTTYRIQAEDKIFDHAVSTDKAAFTTRNSVVCIGSSEWHYELAPLSTRPYGHIPSCVFSSDGTKLWVYRPDAMAGRSRSDILVALDAETGEMLSQADLDTVGHGAQLVLHGGHLLLDVGEGQDGAKVFRSSLNGGEIDLHVYPWTDRCLIDFRDGLFMTIHHGQQDVAFHRFPDGEVLLRLPAAAFDSDDSAIYWNGGFLSADIAIVTLMDEEEVQHHYRVDLRTGSVVGRFEAHEYVLLGDGTWISCNGDPVRCHDS